MLPHLQRAREVAFLLYCDGRLLAQDSDVAGALLDAKAILYASRAIGDEQIVISQAIRMACDRMAARLVEQSLSCGSAPKAVLADLQNELAEEAETPFFTLGLRGERAAFDRLLESFQNGEFSFTDFRRITLTSQMYGSFMGGYRFSSPMMFELHTLRLYASMRKERARQLHYLNQVIELAKLPSWEALGAIKEKRASMAAEPPLLFSLFDDPGLFFQQCLNIKAILRSAYTALALERFHQANGRWPATLAELVPRYLSEIPLDPFDGAPLRLARNGSSIVIYSVSADLIDQGGTLLPDPSASGSDVGFILYDPAERRKPGMPFEPSRQP
jgi:hypothetical protein